jgi:hypothetical protein
MRVKTKFERAFKKLLQFPDARFNITFIEKHEYNLPLNAVEKR